MDQLKKQNVFIVKELLKLEDQIKINYKNVNKKIHKLEYKARNDSPDNFRSKSHSANRDPYLMKGSVPDLNCAACDSDLKPKQVEKLMVNEMRLRSNENLSKNINKLFPARHTNAKNHSLNTIIEHSKQKRNE